ncbi:hypothetical protein SKAU_G00079430 [Synaphobranchus kaupii]|uniref:Uncharacterized protein n=1 Tax=Synaphobranchus kaupii TaxID=118154 RepID=A0A9Q1FVC9_SYNKA|nr:hypothetical protein SKAU_G00079430 [Synaphobranchus kaupii]
MHYIDVRICVDFNAPHPRVLLRLPHFLFLSQVSAEVITWTHSAARHSALSPASQFTPNNFSNLLDVPIHPIRPRRGLSGDGEGRRPLCRVLKVRHPVDFRLKDSGWMPPSRTEEACEFQLVPPCNRPQHITLISKGEAQANQKNLLSSYEREDGRGKRSSSAYQSESAQELLLETPE